MNIFVFDIETVPDTRSGSKILGLEGLPDSEVAEAMFALRRAETGHEFVKLHLQRIVAISVVLKSGDDFKVWSLGNPEDDEAQLLTRFYRGLDKFKPTLVSWNGSGFDLPVMHYRSLLHGIDAARYWETGDNDQTFRWNNYLNRYHNRHLDLMDTLAGYSARAYAPLDEIAIMLGLPGKMGMSGAHVWDAYQAGEIESIRNYCETDVLNTYLVYLHFERMRGNLSESNYLDARAECQHSLAASGKPHLIEFNDALSAGATSLETQS